ncbi:MAG TPA: amino acid permease [Terriglobales bacterium]|nr:amino acid permease [Terriglobales bacterium]
MSESADAQSTAERAISTQEAGLRRQLSAGQMAMVAVGGSIGTGLLLGSGAAIQMAGPAVILTYALGAFLAWTVINALGEMASVHPAAGSFGVYADLYLNNWAGFVVRYGYWLSLVVAIGSELVAAATYTHFWFPALPTVLMVAVFAIGLLVVNLRPVHDYGRIEYWFSMIKVITIVIFVLLGASLLLTGKVAPQYRAEGGGFLPHGPASPLLAISFALFSFLGIEFLAVSSGEARAQSEIPRATRLAFALLTFVYVGATVVLVGVMPWQQAGVSQSPFVTVFQVARLPAVSQVMNFVVLTAALSGANASLYVAARMLFSLARSGYAPPQLGRLSAAGEPRAALLLSGIGILVAMLAAQYAPERAYLYIIEGSLFGGMLAWCISLLAHVSFRRRLPRTQVAALPMRAPGGAAMSIIGFVGIVIAIASTWWTPQSRVTVVSGLPGLLILSVGYLLVRRRRQP